MYYKFIYKIKKGSDFTFNLVGDTFPESTIIAKNNVVAYRILKKNYPHFKKNEVYLYKKEKMPNLFK